MTRRRLTVSEAADALSISQDAVRMRIKRGTLEAERDGRQVFVLLDTVGSGVGSQPESEALISAKDETIATLREQLQAERQAHAEARRIIAGLVERIPPAIEPPTEATQAPSEATEQPGRVEPQPAVESTQEPREASEMHMPEVHGGPLPHDRRSQTPSERRSWWRRMFGS